jgi:hypothetical protein
VQVTLLYTESGLTYSKTFEALSFKGIDEPDRLRLNAITHDYLNGNLDQQVDGFFKEPIEITFNPTMDDLSMRFLTSWFIASVKLFVYGAYISQGKTDETLISEWLYDCEHNRAFTVKFWDEHKFYEWQDGISAEGDMYIKLAVEMSQDATEASPESFTTNSGKLVLMENGESFPSFNSVTHDFYISILASSGSGAIYPVGSSTVSAGDLTFSTFPESGYVTSSDGKLWANFAIYAVAK